MYANGSAFSRKNISQCRRKQNYSNVLKESKKNLFKTTAIGKREVKEL